MLKMLAEEATTPAVRDFLAVGRTLPPKLV